MQSIEDDQTLDPAEKTKRKQNLLLLHNLNVGSPIMSGGGLASSIGSTPTTPSSTVSSTMSPHAPSFYPAGDTVESVIGKFSSRSIKSLNILIMSCFHAYQSTVGKNEGPLPKMLNCPADGTSFFLPLGFKV